MHNVLISILRTSVSFFILMAIAVWIGKQVNSKNNYYNFSLALIVGSFIANMGFDTKLPFLSMLAALLSLVLIYFLFAVISSRSRRFRMWISGKPTVIIEKGEILDKNMKKIKYSLDDLTQQLREQGIFDLDEVDYALLEVSGKLSVLKKNKYKTVTNQDLFPNKDFQKANAPLELIMDGAVIEQSLTSTYTRSWLEQQLQIRKVKINDIYYAVISSNGTLSLDLYDDHVKNPSFKK